MIEFINKYFDRTLFQLIHHVTFKCNARCGTCFNWHLLNQEIEQELTLEEIQKFSEHLPSFPWLLLSGGEPFLREDLNEIIRVYCINNNIRHLTAPTNGLLTDQVEKHTKDILERNKELSMTLSFSLDDIGERHDKIRGVKGNFDKLLYAYKEVKGLKRKYPNLAIKFNTVVSSWNVKYIDEIVEFVKGLKPDMHSLDFIRGDPKDVSMALPHGEERAKTLRKIKDLYDYYGGYENITTHGRFMAKLSKRVMQRYLKVFSEVVDKQEQVIPCLAGTTNLVLYARGDVSSCEMLPTYANIRAYDYDYNKIIQSQESIERHESIVRKECYCYHPCYQYVNILLNPVQLMKSTEPEVLNVSY